MEHKGRIRGARDLSVCASPEAPPTRSGNRLSSRQQTALRRLLGPSPPFLRLQGHHRTDRDERGHDSASSFTRPRKTHRSQLDKDQMYQRFNYASTCSLSSTSPKPGIPARVHFPTYPNLSSPSLSLPLFPTTRQKQHQPRKEFLPPTKVTKEKYDRRKDK